jgi:chemotaxis protein methyltransferase CheR
VEPQTLGNNSQTKVSTAGIELLRDLIHQNTGIFFEPGNFYLLLDKVEPLVKGGKFRSLVEFYFHLKDRPAYSEDWRRVMDALSVQETYFWREMDQIHALVDVIVPKWFEQRNDLLRIWVAACATGEEAFTIAIALEEAGFGHKPIQIIASDASEAALQKAQTGIYKERSCRVLPPDLRSQYFIPIRDQWLLSPAIMSRVRFERANLVASTETAELASANVIFCRNVFIYFSEETIRTTVTQFADKMPDGGHLCVGTSESLLRLTNDFTLTEIGHAFIYVRKNRSEVVS